MVIGPVAIAYNVDGLDKLILDGPTAAKIFQGTIKTWNDPAIAKLNPGATLPSTNDLGLLPLGRVRHHRELHQVPVRPPVRGAWTGKPAKKWTGTGAGKEKSAGVAEGVKSTKNSITYVEWSYAIDNKLGIAQIDTGAGPVELTADSAGKALAAAKPAGTGTDLALKLDYATKAPGAYPIILVTYEVACSKGLTAEKTALVKSFLSYFVSADGQGALTELHYAPLPDRPADQGRRGRPVDQLN